MSEDNVHIVRRWVAAFNRPEDVAGFVRLWDPECEFFTLFGTQLADAPYKGHGGLSQYLSERSRHGRNFASRATICGRSATGSS